MFEFGEEREETIVGRDSVTRNYFHVEYRFQPGLDACVYDVVGHLFRSKLRPVNYAYIITAAVCEGQVDAYRKQRLDI